MAEVLQLKAFHEVHLLGGRSPPVGGMKPTGLGGMKFAKSTREVV